MRDICLLRYNRIAPVEVDTELVSAHVIRMTSKRGGLTYTSRVEINDADAPEFTVISDRELHVTVPMSLWNSLIESAVVYVEVSTPERAVDLDIQLTPDYRSGLLRISQEVIKLLLTTAGTDIFHPNSGGSLDTLIKRTSLSDPTAISGVVSGAVQRVKKQIIASQTNRLLGAEEQLTDLRVTALNIDITSLSVAISLKVITRGGTTELAFPLDASGR